APGVDGEPPSLPGPGYSPDKALEMVRTRCERLPPLLRHTLPRLLADARIRGLFAELRGEGWKDWHLLNALANLRHVDDAPMGSGSPSARGGPWRRPQGSRRPLRVLD